MTSNQGKQPSKRRLLVQDENRLADVEIKHVRVRRFLEEANADALLLQNPANIAWFTAGADVSRLFTDSDSTSLFITAEARLFATNAVDSSQIFEREAFGLGFQLKQREWFQPHHELVADLCRGRRVVSDSSTEKLGESAQVRCAADAIQSIRLPLTELEVARLRKLGRAAVHAVEAAARNLRPGQTEAEVAGEVSHRLVKRTITPARIQVCADGRLQRYRHWSYGETPIENYATVSCVARRWGLHVGVSRTVCINTVPDELWAEHQKAVLLHATGQYFSRSGQSIGQVWQKVHRIYEKFGVPNEWQKADQASVIGYSGSEVPVLPGSDHVLNHPVPVFWHPSVGQAMTGDTILCCENSVERLTHSDSWPQLNVQVKGHAVPCPGILKVQSADSPGQDDPVTESDSLFEAFAEPEDDTSRIDSIWELDLTSGGADFGEQKSVFSPESVLE